jgi:Flp pilus assembly CpaF family ATPase
VGVSPVPEALGTLSTRVSERLGARQSEDKDAGRPRMDVGAQRVFARQVANEVLEGYARERIEAGLGVLSAEEEDDVAQAIDDALFGLGVLDRLLADESIENINANGCEEVWITRADGTKEPGPPLATTDVALVELIRRAGARMGNTERRFDTGHPRLNLQLPDGSRLYAVMSVSHRPGLSIRRHRHPKLFLSDLVGLKTLDAGLEEFLGAAVVARKNIIVCGGTRSGKTTLLRALANGIPAYERLITIEDTFELSLERFPELHHDVFALEVREPNVEGEGAISAADLVRDALRMDPDRLIVGEVRGAEVLPMLNAMSQGNDGSMCTIHSNSSAGAFNRLASYAIQAAERLPLEATNLLVANAIDLVVFVGQERVENKAVRRFVSSVREVVQAEGSMVVSNEIFRPGPDGRAVPGTPMSTGLSNELQDMGYDPGLLDNPNGWWS